MSTVAYAAELRLSESEGICLPDRATAAEAFADAMAVIGAGSLSEALIRVGINPAAFDRYWSGRALWFDVVRFVEDELDPTFAGVHGSYRPPRPASPLEVLDYCGADGGCGGAVTPWVGEFSDTCACCGRTWGSEGSGACRGIHIAGAVWAALLDEEAA